MHQVRNQLEILDRQPTVQMDHSGHPDTTRIDADSRQSLSLPRLIGLHALGNNIRATRKRRAVTRCGGGMMADRGDDHSGWGIDRTGDADPHRR